MTILAFMRDAVAVCIAGYHEKKPPDDEDIEGAIHSTKISGHFGPKLNGLVPSNQKSFEKTGPPSSVGPVRLKIYHSIWLLPKLSQFPVPRFSLFLFNMEESVESTTCTSNYQCSLCRWLSTDLSELLVHLCTVATGMQLLCKVRLLLQFPMMFNFSQPLDDGKTDTSGC